MRPDAAIDPTVLYAPGSAYHVKRRWIEPHVVRCLTSAVTVLGSPASLLDVGCGEGALVKAARQVGIDAVGVDLAAPVDDPAFVRADLRERVDLGRTFAWVCCWEVAEHLPEESAERLVQMLVRHMTPTGRILFTAAPPGQGGPGHIHEMPIEYWMELFYSHGLSWADAPTVEVAKTWRRCSPKCSWYWKNLLIMWRLA